MDLIDTAEWLKNELRLPLESFDITLGEFRTLELLSRQGPLTVNDVSRERRTGLANVKKITSISNSATGCGHSKSGIASPENGL